MRDWDSRDVQGLTARPPGHSPVTSSAELIATLAAATAPASLARLLVHHFGSEPGVACSALWLLDGASRATFAAAFPGGNAAAEMESRTAAIADLIQRIEPAGTLLRLTGESGFNTPAWLLPLAVPGQAPVGLLAVSYAGEAPAHPPLDPIVARASASLLQHLTQLANLQRSEQRYRSLVSQANEIILIGDPTTGTIIDANPKAAEALGYLPAQLIGLPFAALLGTSGLLSPASSQANHHLRMADGNTLEVDILYSNIQVDGREALLILARDANLQQQLDRQVMQAQKMESLGQMAGQIAHEFNNQLATIMGFSGIIRRTAELDDAGRENLQMLEDAAQRAAGLTGRLLAFARGNLSEFGPINLTRLLAETIRLTEPTWAPGIAVTFAAPPHDLLIDGDPGQLQQAFLNILLNAADAIRSTNGTGTIAITVAALNQRAHIAISDDGPGMPESVRQHVFEPFFTTKPPGAGTGLGLAISYGVIRAHHGTIHLQSSVGEGTSFTIELPLAETDHASGYDPQQPLALIALTDPEKRAIIRTRARNAGYTTIELASQGMALRVLEARPSRFALCVLDDIDDPAVCAAALRHQPGLRLISSAQPIEVPA